MPLLKVVTSLVVIRLTIMFGFLSMHPFLGCCTYCGKMKEDVSGYDGSMEVCCTAIVVEILWGAMHSSLWCGI